MSEESDGKAGSEGTLYNEVDREGAYVDETGEVMSDSGGDTSLRIDPYRLGRSLLLETQAAEERRRSDRRSERRDSVVADRLAPGLSGPAAPARKASGRLAIPC